MPDAKRDSLRWRVAVSLILVLVFVALGIGIFRIHLLLRRNPAKVAGGPPRTVVRVEVAERGPYRERLRGYGLARALRQAQVSAEVGGLVVWVSPRLEAGAAVEEGEELVRLDRRDFAERVNAARARTRQAEAALARLKIDLESLGRRLAIAREDHEAAKRELERVRSLVPDVLNRSDLDRQIQLASQNERLVVQLGSQAESARADLGRVDAEVAAAEAALAQAEHDLERTIVRAPYAGRIVARQAEEGSRVAPGSPLFTLVDLSRVEVPVAVGASRFGEVRPGAAAVLRLSEGGEIAWRGRVDRVAPTVNSADRTFLVYLVVEGDAGEAPIPPGAFVVAELDGLLHEDVIPLPRVAFVGDHVYVADPDGGALASIREVRPRILRKLPDTVLVTGGVEPGDRVVVTNLEQIAGGSRVQVATAGTGDARAPSAPGAGRDGDR